MSQIKFAADLTASAFPLLYDWAGRTVVQPQIDQGRPPFLQPQILYCQDVLPTLQGYKSVSYKNLIPAADPANLFFKQEFTVSDAAQNKALIGVTIDSKIYMLTDASPGWVDVTPAGWSGGDAVTTGNANGSYYLYLANKGCYLINITGVALTLTALTSITAANIVGMFSSVNYLLLWDAVGTIYWSSTTNPLDFTPSLITGAGSSIPYDLKGQIIAVVALGNGFIIYTNTNIVLGNFSNNTQFPWIFRGANNSAGIADKYKVSYRHDLGFHVALTFIGVLQVTLQGCEVIVPEVSDFIAARVYESYNTTTNTITKQDLASVVVTRLNVIGARYIVLSYGLTEFTDLLIYDSALKRWGKLKATHTCCFEIEASMEGVISPYNDPAEVGQTYAAASPETYVSAAVTLNDAPILGRILGLLTKGGSINIAFLDFDSISDNAVLLLGKYQLVRSALFELNEVALETLPGTNTNFSLRNFPSINGRDWITPVSPTLVESGGDVRIYMCRTAAKNHTLCFKGSFNLTSVEITGVVSGRR